MSAEALADRAARLAAAVARLGDDAWAERVTGLVGVSPPVREGVRPTYREIAHAGTGLVAALADVERWDDAAREARELKRFFAATPDELGPVAVEAFDGLLAASMARDRDELEDFVDLVEALFP